MLLARAVTTILVLLPLIMWGQGVSPRVLKGPDGVSYTYNLTGNTTAASPKTIIPDPTKRCNSDNNKISYALVHQLVDDPELYRACQKIVEDKLGTSFYFRGLDSLCAVGFQITFGAGYYLFCPGQPNPYKDLKFKGDKEIYQIHVDTQKGKIYVAEKRGEEVLEVNESIIGKKWFESDPEEYELPYVTGQPSCETPYFLDPRAIIAANPTQGVAPLNVQFDGSNSYDQDQDGARINTYRWNFGDGDTASGAEISHTFQRPGTYEVSLTVTDNEDVTHDTTQLITVQERPANDSLPVSIFTTQPSSGQVPLLVALDGSESYDQDEKGASIVRYEWDFGDGQRGEGVTIQHSYTAVGSYKITLVVTDNEGSQATSSRFVMVSQIPPPPVPVPTPCPDPDTCYTMLYTVSTCGNRIDTLTAVPMRVACPAPSRNTVIFTGCNCPETAQPVPAETSPLELAGGPNFRFFRGQITEYGMGFNGQIRYRLDQRRRAAIVGDFGVVPVRRALPSDDRPYKWSPLRDSIDVATGRPLVWHRGSLRGTANAALGFEFAPYPWLYAQITTGLEWSFNQIEASDPAKDPNNAYKGFETRINYYEPRIGIRRSHLEVYYSIQFLPENRPFTFIPANQTGGTHNRLTDKTHNAGMLLWF
ncbi:MAG: PKD domain-containing protein [Bacteroidota bacterium]